MGCSERNLGFYVNEFVFFETYILLVDFFLTPESTSKDFIPFIGILLSFYKKHIFIIIIVSNHDFDSLNNYR